MTNNSHSWKPLLLDDCLESLLRGVAPKYVESSPIAALNQKAIRWGYINVQALKYHDPDKPIKDEAFIRKGDIALNSTGDITIGRAYYFRKEWPNLFADSHVAILRLKRTVLLPEYFIYLLATSEYQKKIYNLVSGTTGQLELNRTSLRKLEVIVPPLPIQRTVAGILSAYDDLIENNTRRIAVLEEIAQSIYREWFVHFRFPGHEAVRLITSSLGKIPNGWEPMKLADVTSYINRGVSPKYDDSVTSRVINQKCIRDNAIDLTKARTHRTTVPSDKRLVFGDILINSTGRGTLGRVAQVYAAIEDCTVDSHVTIVRPANDASVDYLGFVAYHLQEHFDHHGTGSTGQTELPRSVIGGTHILFPSVEVQDLFSRTVRPLRTLGEVLRRKNDNLRNTRDLILPKLASGQVDLTQLDLQTGEPQVEATT